MRFSSALSSLLLSLALLADAAPLASDGEVRQRDVKIEAPTWSTTFVSEPSESSHKDTSNNIDGADPQINTPNQAHAVVPCQACGEDGADVYPTFEVELQSPSAGFCDVALSINGSIVHLSKASPSASLDVTSEPDLYSLNAELSCGSEDSNSASPLLPVVSVFLEAFNHHRLSARPGIQITVGTEASISNLRIFQEVHQGKLSAAPSIAATGRSIAQEDALDLLDRVEAVRQVLVEQQSADPEHHPLAQHTWDIGLGIQPSQPNTTVGRCGDHFRHEIACAAQSVCEKFCDALHSLLTRVKSTLGQDRTAHYQGKIQKVMTAVKSRVDCKKGKEQKEHNDHNEHNEVLKASSTEKLDKAVYQEPKRVRLSEVQSPIIIALESLAAVLGLGGLYAFLRRRCCSLRRRVERLADREERMKQAEYRRAARKEAWRRRWTNIRRTCTCCFGSADCEEDTEKAALVNNIADEGRSDEEGDLEMAIAHLDGLHYAHEIVAEMVRSRRNLNTGRGTYSSSMAVAQQLDAAYPYPQPHHPRSRASSLPSYNSDVLPDYSSQPGSADLEHSIRVVDGLRRPDSCVSSAGSSRCTPDSSIPSISPRPSAETLRTAESRDSYHGVD